MPKKGKKRLRLVWFAALFIAITTLLLFLIKLKNRNRPAGVKTENRIIEVLPPIAKPVHEKPAKHKNLPRLAIVIDDVGYDNRTLKSFIGLDLPLTYAILPNATEYKQSVDILREAHLDYLVHMPMQPENYPRINPGENALLINMSDSKIRNLTEEAIKKIPGAIGANNHMGSAFIQNKNKMQAFLAVLKEHNLFFLDSETTSKTVGWKLAKYDGVGFARRDIFLDNVKNLRYIENQLFKAANYAKLHKVAIAIGHDNPITEEALAETKDELSKQVDFVEVKTVINSHIR